MQRWSRWSLHIHEHHCVCLQHTLAHVCDIIASARLKTPSKKDLHDRILQRDFDGGAAAVDWIYYAGKSKAEERLAHSTIPVRWTAIGLVGALAMFVPTGTTDNTKTINDIVRLPLLNAKKRNPAKTDI